MIFLTLFPHHHHPLTTIINSNHLNITPPLPCLPPSVSSPSSDQPSSSPFNQPSVSPSSSLSPSTNMVPHESIIPLPTHHMKTRAQSGIYKPIHRLNLHTTSIFLVLQSHLQALHDPNWKIAMNDEFNAPMTNDTWQLVPRPPGSILSGLCGFFCNKFHVGGTLFRYKARLVANGRGQEWIVMRLLAWLLNQQWFVLFLAWLSQTTGNFTILM